MAHTPPPEPSLDTYPGYFPAKVAWWKRKWVQLAGTALIAFAIGSAGSTTDAQPAADQTKTVVQHASADELAAAKAAGADEQQTKLDALTAQLAKVRDNERAVIAKVRRQAKAQQRSAVAGAWAQAKQKRAAAVAAAVAQTKASIAASAPRQVSSSGSGSSGGLDPRFRTCGEANDNGYGPYTEGQDPEYDWYIDRDGDGIDCEP